MNEPILPPLPPETVDELLSAALDGELDAAAADLGIGPEAARAAVAANRERGEQLAAARDAVADVPPLDEVARRRLVADATAAAGGSRRDARAHRSPRRLALGGVAAAVLAVLLLGVGTLTVVGITSWRSSERADDAAGGDADRAGGAASPEAADSAPPPDLGEVSDPAVLREAVAFQLAPGEDSDGNARFEMLAEPDEGAESTTTDPASRAAGAPTPTGAAPRDAREDDRLRQSDGEAAATTGAADPSLPACAARVAEELQRGDDPLLLATAVYGDREAGVSVFGAGDRTLVVVYALDDCTLLTSQSWRSG